MANALATRNESNAQMMESVVVDGDLSKLSPPQRLDYYRHVCESVGLNPFTKPFDYIRLNGKLTLYARKDAADQLRKLHGISLAKPDVQYVDDLIVVTIEAQDKDGRTDSDVGAVVVGNLKGEAKANAIMKAITKAKRRVTLSIAGLGWLDETELDTIPAQAVQRVTVDVETGEIVEPVTPTTNGNGNGHKPQPEAPADDVAMISELQMKRLHAVGTDFYGDEWKAKRPELVHGATKKRAEAAGVAPWTSSKDLTESEADRLIRGIQQRIDTRNYAAEHSDEQPDDNPFTETPEPVTA